MTTQPTGPPTQISPPIDYPVLGLADYSWIAERRLEEYQVVHLRRDQTLPPTHVWLGHADHTGQHGIRVGTYHAARFAAYAAEAGNSPADQMTNDVARLLVEFTAPTDEVRLAQKHRYPRAMPDLIDHLSVELRNPQGWTSARWMVDGTPATARIRRFASAWAGVAPMSGTEHVILVGTGYEPDGLVLLPVNDRQDYGFNLAAALDGWAVYRGKGWRRSILPSPNATGFHPEQIDILASGSAERA